MAYKNTICQFVLTPTDLALMRLPDPFPILPPFVPIDTIALNDQVADLTGRTITVSGWGGTENTKRPHRLSKADLRVNKWLTRLASGTIVLSQSQGKGACMGDSGGKRLRSLDHDT